MLTRELGLHRTTQIRVLHKAVHRRLLREHRIEVRHIDGADDARLERRPDLLLRQLLKVDVFRKEIMALDVFRTLDTKTAGGVAGEQLGKDGAGVFRELVSKFEGLVQDLLVHLICVLVVEGREAVDHLVEENTEGPPVNGFVVAVSGENLGREVLGCAAEGVGLFVLFHVELTQAEIAQGNVTVVVEENVLRLQVTVDSG